LKNLVEVEVELVCGKDNVQQDGSSLAKSVLNPLGSQEKGQQNNKLKSVNEKKCNQGKARKKV